MGSDPGFVTAVERAYLSLLRELEPTGELALVVHTEILDRAIYMADPTNGGIRYKKLPDTQALEDRLARSFRLSWKVGRASSCDVERNKRSGR